MRRSSSEMTNGENVRPIANPRINSADFLSQLANDEELAKLFNNNSNENLPNNENLSLSIDIKQTPIITKNSNRQPLSNDTLSVNSKMDTFESLPDQAVILERLVRIREYKQQVLDALDKIKNNGEEIDRGLLSKLIKAYDSFKEQEEQYLMILQKVLALKQQLTLKLSESSSQSELSDVSDRTPLPSFSADLAADVVKNAQHLRPRTVAHDVLSKSLQNRERTASDIMQNPYRQRRSSDFELKAYQEFGDKSVQSSIEPHLLTKSYELEALKEKLETLRTLCDVTSEEFIRKPNDAEGQRTVKNKLQILNENKKRVDVLLNCIDNVDEVIGNTEEHYSHNSSAITIDRKSSGRSNNFATSFANPASSLYMPAPNARALVKSSSPSAEPKRNQKSQHENLSFKSDSEQSTAAFQQKYNELTETKNRLAKLQHLVGQLQDNVDLGVSSSAKPANSQATLGKKNEVETGEDSESEIANMAALSFRMRSAYESKLNEQQQAVQNLQEEHERLMAIKNQLMTLSNAQVHSNASQSGSKSVERPSRQDASAVHSNDEDWKDMRQQHLIQQQHKQDVGSSPTVRHSRPRTSSEQQLNNFKENIPDHSNLSRSRPRVNEHLNSEFGSMDHDDVANADIRYQNNATSSTIANNPRLPSFRRNNHLGDNISHSETSRRYGGVPKRDDVPLPSTPRRMSLDNCSQYECQRRDSHDHHNGTNLEQQYLQLQQHIDSIRSIFQQLMKEHNVGHNIAQQSQSFTSQQGNSMNTSQQPLIDAAAKLLVQQQNPWDHLYSSLNPSSLAVQQQQLMVSLFSCQQQLQLQQMEMRYLQQLCQDLLSTRRTAATENTETFQSTRSRSASLVQTMAPQIPVSSLQAGAVNLPPLDGRPLSTASLYNLLAPNPYLTFPYYSGPQQFQQVYQNGLPTNEQQQQKFTQNGHYRSVQPYASSNAKYPKPIHSRHAQNMSQSLIEHGSERVYSDGESNVNAKLMSMSDTIRSTTKLNEIESNPIYNKSNVSKKQKNIDGQEYFDANNTRQQFSSGFPSDATLTGDQFDTLREMIYSEVATLISQNEQRPHFLLELFRELQLLSSDHLRMRALQAVRNVLTRYLFNEDEESHEFDHHVRPVAASQSVVEETQTESAGTSEDENLKQTRRFRDNPAKLPETVSHPSAALDADEIILVCSEKDEVRAKRFENLESKKVVKDSNDIIAQSCAAEAIANERTSTEHTQNVDASENSKEEKNKSNVDVGGLEQQIQSVVDELIPFLKDNVDSVCNSQLLQRLRKMVISLAISKCLPTGSANTFFQRQLSSILDDTLAKFQGQNLNDCGEELLGDVSEVVFNELAFFRLMQNIDSVDNEPRKSDADESEDNLGHETTEPEEEEEEDSDKSSARPSSPEAFTATAHQDLSEISEDVDVSAITAISTSREAVRVDVANPSTESRTALSSDIKPIGTEKSRRSSSEFAKAVEVVLTKPLTVQVTSATDDDENSVSTSDSTSMHTAGNHPYDVELSNDNLVKQTSADSRETTPPDELLLDAEEVPENIDNVESQAIAQEREITTFDLDFEPHPEDKLQLTIDSVEFRNLQNELMIPDEVEEEDDDQQENVSESGVDLKPNNDNNLQTCSGD